MEIRLLLENIYGMTLINKYIKIINRVIRGINFEKKFIFPNLMGFFKTPYKLRSYSYHEFKYLFRRES